METNFKKRTILFAIAALVLVMITGIRSFGQGSGAALSFNNHLLQTTNPVTHGIGSGNFTWEAWIRPSVAANGTSGTGTGFMANGSYAPAFYASTGGTAPAAGFGSFGIYWGGIGGTSWKNSGVKLVADKWYHVALVRSDTTLSFYVNGVKAPNTYTINASASMANAPMRLGYSGDGSEYFQGNMDEVRVWAVARTEAQLREAMCRKLVGNETGLKVYYRLDEAAGTSVANAVTATVGAITLPAANAPSWTVSGAPIGDTSVQLYATSFGTQSLTLGSVANGSIMVNNIANAFNGVHIYRVNQAPNTTAGIPNVGTNDVYYGVFTADTALSMTGNNYNLQYDYNGFPAAVTFASGINLYNRANGNTPWTLAAATNNQATHLFQLNAVTERKEWFIGNFVTAGVCTPPTALNAQNITATSAALSWTTGGSDKWNISWSAGSTFPPASGTIVAGLATAAYDLTGLTPNTVYSFYVRDTCSSINSSSTWTGPFTFTTAPDLTMGAGTGLYFNGSESITSTANITHAVDTNDFTWEAWINPAKITGSTCFMTNGNYVPGFYATTAGAGGNGSVGFYWGGWKNSNTFIEKDKWSHVAMVRSHDTITIYVNGIAAPNRFVMHNAMTNSKLRLGWSGDAGEYFQGVLDEVRVWNVARTEAELRAAMCHKLQGNETGLINYLPLNEGAAAITTDVAGTALFNTINPARWRVSGAAIGDTSIAVYPQDWAGIQNALGSNAYGTFTADSVTGNVKGLHVYRVNNHPNYLNGIQDPGNTQQYFGVFTAGDYNSAGYKIHYDYSTYPAAVANNAGLHVYNRKDNAVVSWTQTPAVNNTTTQKIEQKQNFGTRQYILADFSAAGCPSPYPVTVGSVDTGSATVSLTSAAASHIVEYGEPNFLQGSGTVINAGTLSIPVTDLLPAHAYEFYIKDSCSATSTSAWSGPYSFLTLDPCPQPSGVYADSITSNRIIVKWTDNGTITQDYTVSWGPQGFGDPALGILTTVTEKRFLCSGLPLNATYDFYIRSNCNSSKANSAWAGPFSFSTVACDKPYNLTVQHITGTTATISWITGGATLHNLQYGPSGFAVGTGSTQSDITTASYDLSSLSANTAYDVYVQDSCSDILGSSVWAGPLTFTTLAGTSINDPEHNYAFSLYPNPAKDMFMVSLPVGHKTATITMFNNLGVIVYQVITDKEEANINTASLPSGMYFIEAGDGSRKTTKKVVVQH